jgi:hypothetical protein
MDEDDDEPPARPFRLGGWFWFWLLFGLAFVAAGALMAHFGPSLFPPAR